MSSKSSRNRQNWMRRAERKIATWGPVPGQLALFGEPAPVIVTEPAGTRTPGSQSKAEAS